MALESTSHSTLVERALSRPVDPAWWAEAMKELRQGPSNGNGSKAKYASDLPILRLDEFIKAVDNLPDQDYLIDPILPIGQIMAFVGDPWAGKSLEEQRLAMNIANGDPFHGLPVKKRTPLYLTWEGAAKGIQGRFMHMLDGTKQKELPYVKMLSSPIYINTGKGKAEFIKLIQKHQAATGISVVMIDSFPYTCKGRYQEDEVINAWFAAAKEIAQTLNVTLIFVWEFTKPIIFQGEEANPYDLSRLKGAYGVAYKMDTVICIGNLHQVTWDKKLKKTVRADMGKRLVVMKSKDLPPFPPLSIELDPESLFFKGQKWVNKDGIWIAEDSCNE